MRCLRGIEFATAAWTLRRLAATCWAKVVAASRDLIALTVAGGFGSGFNTIPDFIKVAQKLFAQRWLGTTLAA